VARSKAVNEPGHGFELGNAVDVAAGLEEHAFSVSGQTANQWGRL
jgi:hypothetical protein